ncbi:MAG: 3-dehydroquinate synthase [Gammaproteobacteria bacterium]|nr:3-dehydroquinate synthase [Gammaproteobacteria bacterium]
MHSVQVELGDRSYPIYIGSGLLSRGDIYREHIPANQVLVVTNDMVAPLYLDQVLKALAKFRHASVILPDGEQNKTLGVWNLIFDTLMKERFNRQCTILALGGGVVGDMAGFAAACYQRGVNFVQAPTTLLSQVDSSVGGKTGVNHPAGKNMIGAFYQPRCVIIDIQSLDTLEDRQYSAGLAEIIKYGLINDGEFFCWLEGNMERLLDRDREALVYAIDRSCRDKASVVALDETEQGKRALLNLGHTFGHAIETGMGYGEWLHGEAVAAGICMAGELSRRLGWLGEAEQKRIIALIQRACLPTTPPRQMRRTDFLSLMGIDKKVQNGRIRLVLMRSLGDAVVTDDFDPQALNSMLDGYGRAL